MSLQGTIETFAIADVLRLLAATNKSGRLQVQGPARSGTVWVDDAKVLAAEAPAVAHADGPAEVLFQLLRFDRGSFRFDLDKYPPAPAEPVEIELALADAEAMLAEWRELERVIPSTEAWVALTPELRDGNVTVNAEQWRTIVAIGSGRVVAALGEALGLGELDTFRAVDQLLQLGVVEVGARPTSAPAIESPASQLAPPAPAPTDAGPSEESRRGGELGGAAFGASTQANGAAEPGPAPSPVAGPPAWPGAEAPPTSSEPPPFVSFSPPPAAPAPPPDAAGPKAEAGLHQVAQPAPGFSQGYDTGPAGDTASAAGGEQASAPFGEYPYGTSGYGHSEHTQASFDYTSSTSAAAFSYEAPAAAELDSSAAGAPAAESENGAAPWAAAAPPAPEARAPEAHPGQAADVTRARALFDAPAPPPPPAPPLPSRGPADETASGWSPAAWFEGSAPERLAPPPPPPPPPAGQGTWGEPAQADTGGEGSVMTAGGATTEEAEAQPAPQQAEGDAPEDAANIERQLFNLSERAREAVKRSSGLFDGRSRR